jgi:hypothetical protein
MLVVAAAREIVGGTKRFCEAGTPPGPFVKGERTGPDRDARSLPSFASGVFSRQAGSSVREPALFPVHFGAGVAYVV